MKKLLFALAALASLFSAPAYAATPAQAFIVSACGSLPSGLTYAASTYGIITMDTTGKLCDGSSGGSTTANQGTAAALSGAWPIEITDGTNGPVAVKAASTPAVATDKSAVVQLNPDSPGIIVYVDPCQNPGVLKSSVAINTSSATTTQLVAISGLTAIYVCGYSFTINNVVTTASTAQFEYGTSTNCTGTHALTGVYNTGSVTAGIPTVISYGNGGATVFTVPSANGLCIVTAGTGDDDGVLSYVQL